HGQREIHPPVPPGWRDPALPGSRDRRGRPDLRSARARALAGSPQRACRPGAPRSRGAALQPARSRPTRLRPGEPRPPARGDRLAAGLGAGVPPDRGDDGRAPRASALMTSPPPAELAVVAEEVEFEYPAPRRVLALKGVTLRIPKGQFAAIVGQNGSGKTSLARCISGYLRPTRGSLRVAGTEVWRLRPAQRATRVGYVFQNPDH